MKIYHWGYSEHFDGPGTRLIYYLKGCNFRCRWCGAPESIALETQTLRYPERTVIAGEEIAPQTILRKAQKAGNMIAGVTFGGGEPTLQAAELLATLKLLRQANIHTAIESNASTPDYPEIAGCTDLVFSDLKTVNETVFCERISPHTAWLERVKANLRWAAENVPDLVVRIPCVTHLNDTPQAQAELAAFLNELREVRPTGYLNVQLLRQHHLAESKYEALGMTSPCKFDEPPPRENLENFAQKLIAEKIHATIFG